jgi:hypothetical protein
MAKVMDCRLQQTAMGQTASCRWGTVRCCWALPETPCPSNPGALAGCRPERRRRNTNRTHLRYIEKTKAGTRGQALEPSLTLKNTFNMTYSFDGGFGSIGAQASGRKIKGATGVQF